MTRQSAARRCGIAMALAAVATSPAAAQDPIAPGPVQAYMAAYSLELARDIPQLETFGGSYTILLDRLCTAWKVHNRLDMTIGSNGQTQTTSLTDISLEHHDGSRLSFEITVAQNDQVVQRNVGAIAATAAGGHEVVLTAPRALPLPLPGAVSLPVGRNLALLADLQAGRMPTPTQTFMPVSLQLATIETRVDLQIILNPQQSHVGDPLTGGPAWIVTDIYTPTSGPNVGQPRSQQYVVGLDGVPIQLLFDVDSLPVMMRLIRFDRQQPTCPKP